MPVLHRIKIPGGKKPAPLINSMGQWESAAGEVHTFNEGMVQLTVAIGDDHTMHLFCEAGQVDRVPSVLAELIGKRAVTSASTLHRIKTPGSKKSPSMVSPIGEWLPAARETDYCEPMAELMVIIDGENWFDILCPVDQIDRVPAALARLIGGAQ